MTESVTRTPNEAYERYIEPLRDALGCITAERLAMSERASRVVEKLYPVFLNKLTPVPLRGGTPLLFRMGQEIKIVDVGNDEPGGRYRIRTLRYLYAFSTTERKELLAFHWHPQEEGGAIPFSHLHIGAALTGEHPPLRPETLHKAHIPTGRVSLESVVRLAITEFGVVPLRANWEGILQRTEEAFVTHKTW